MKTPTLFPYYHIHAEIVKASLGLKDSRAIRKHFIQAGIDIKMIGGKECVMAEDLVNAGENQTVFVNYTPKSKSGKTLNDLL
jgi:hypothetical protein